MLDHGTLRLNTFANMNDPREKKSWAPNITLGPGGVGPELFTEIDNAEKTVDHLLRAGARVACFTVTREPTKDAALATNFHQGWARARMWDQYAEAHQGAVLVFACEPLVRLVDEALPVSDRRMFGSNLVRYVDRPLSLELNMEDVSARGLEEAVEALQIARGAPGELYFTKNTDWESEQEFRIVSVEWKVAVETPVEPLDISFGNTLLAVVLGQDFPEDQIPAISRFRNETPSIEVLRCQWRQGAPEIHVLAN